MNTKKIASFSLLAHINNNSIGITSFEDIFIPLIKSSLCKLNRTGVKSGQSIMEIKEVVDNSFFLDIPVPILKELLVSISNEVETNSENQFILHKDGAFQMNKYLFDDYEEELEQRETEINEIDRLYKSYLTSNGLDYKNQPSIYNYIDQNRILLSKYFAFKQEQTLDIEYIHQANFINSIRSNIRIYNILRRIYLGSIIAAYLEVQIGKTNNKIELLLDTNFILGLLDLNSIEATHTCRKISEICDRLGYTKSILPFTIEEIEMLIERKANLLDNAFFQGYLDPESIYNAAKRRNLSKTQLQQISKNLTKVLQKDFNILLVGNDQKLRNMAKYQYSDIYEFYKKLRKENNFSALHDTTAIAYVKEKRGKNFIKGDLYKANCWFVTNTPYTLAIPEKNGNLPEIIRAEEILNFLWLSNPSVTGLISSNELSEMGLTRLVSTTISYSLPSPKVLRDLDDNFNTYGGSEITADDTIMVAAMISKKKIDKPEELNKIALNNPDNFILKVKEYAEQGRAEEKEINEKLDKLLAKLEIVARKPKLEKKEKKENTIETEVIKETELNINNQHIISSNNPYKKLLIIVSLAFISFIWWTLDFIININFLTEPQNIIRLKLLVQIFLITVTLSIFCKKLKEVWITGSITLIIAIIAILTL